MSSRESVLDRDRATVAGGRLGRIVAAYALAAVAGAIARTFGLVAQETAVRGFAAMIETNGVGALVVVPLLSGFVAFLAAAPFVTAFLVFAEGSRARSLWIYVVAGAVIGPLAQLLIGLFDASGRSPGVALYGLDALAGAVAGWVYWTVAVRAAPPAPLRLDTFRRDEPRF
ncbi:hypothetical protein [Pinisolibacter sp.]|uniref:hypothetical protein n=1 Tax=Pinisolibacter sp. TaxID=2172024 RepID=UPI002FDC96B5